MKKILRIVLLEDDLFKNLVCKMEKVFGIRLPYENKKGRFISEGDTATYKVILVDRIDDLSDMLCDEHHTLDIHIDMDKSFNYEKYEEDVVKKLENGKIRWKYGIWTKMTDAEEYRKIYPVKRV
ncbi:hypothetical protein [Paenibacillus macquariensis]|uniref:Uncharacterized protein n=1 Tax=Paenibacillus macquariensis TaxID=948756 RepID=A0ABY1JV65_9BACL|nr:hypothetical protein [Paenibacillus macquariensis]MEC0090853.1 hypothetical protein [Paenibacillus macquariensis]OAB34588.1 hypothetical protein PMSM_12065 [Paenibacillus macquariensis subsp. macquariensis]SIQ82095.1 hypothetical protein SAMN05421578_104210 [Paenibacillus macquariensis]